MNVEAKELKIAFWKLLIEKLRRKGRRRGSMFSRNGKLRELGEYILQGFGIRESARRANVHKNTALKLHRILSVLISNHPNGGIRCPCGQQSNHRGCCSFRFSFSRRRQEFMKRWHPGWEYRGISSQKPSRGNIRTLPITHYPFIAGIPMKEHDLVLTVNTIVPKNLPEEIRSDVCQEIILAHLEGQLPIEDIYRVVPQFIKKVRKANATMFRALSLDSPLKYSPKRTLLDRRREELWKNCE